MRNTSPDLPQSNLERFNLSSTKHKRRRRRGGDVRGGPFQISWIKGLRVMVVEFGGMSVE